MIAIVGHFPTPGAVMEGWMSRIAAVDRVFSKERRTYIQIVENGPSGPPSPQHISELVEVYCLNLSYHSHNIALRTLVLNSEMVYVHTIHLARYVLPFYQTGKIVTDIHGVTPEEELLYGKPGPSRFYEEIERVILSNSSQAIVVTNAMADHYRKKYPASKCEFTVLPIFETIYPRADQRLTHPSPRQRPKVLYSGGAQQWQNVELMLDLAGERRDSCEFTFLSHESELFRRGVEARGIAGFVTISSAKKEDLAAYYLDADYGLVLRDDITVNRVACPTKLSEYLWFGVVPIVLSPDLGDFRKFGYRYVTFEDFKSGKLPSPDELLEMRAKNFEVISAIQNSFEEAADKVRNIKDHLPQREYESITFMTPFERNVFYPAMSQLRVICDDHSESCQIYSDYFVDASPIVEFNISNPMEIRRLTWMPVNRECQVNIKSVNIEKDDGDPVPYNLMENKKSAGDSEPYHSFDFDIAAKASVKRFTASFDIIFEENDVTIREKDNLISQKNMQIDALLNSWSWRITAPLRMLLNFVQHCTIKSRHS